ncbi:hypothetical protein [Xiashengella succiniciproducens]|nr:hypothetical protein [Alkaliflexus sp. Ai-910]
MKRLVTAFVLLLLVTLTISSCKSYEDCPAYGQVETSVEMPVQA